MTTIGSVTSLPPAPTPQSIEAPPDPELEDASVESTTASAEPAKKQPGVIRNLLSGHFKGVAALRLRINFADQLGALHAAATNNLAGEATASFASEATTTMDDLLTHPGLSGDQQTALAELAEAFLADLAATDGTVTSSTETFDQQLADLRASLEEALAEIEPESPLVQAEGELEVDMITDEVEAPLAEPSTLLADARAAVDYLEAQLAAAIESVVAAPTLLPPLSEPSGNGVAYAKFLAIYEDTAEPVPSDPESVEAIVELDVAV